MRLQVRRNCVFSRQCVAGKKSFAASSTQLECPVGRRLAYYSKFCLVPSPVGRRQDCHGNLETRDFWWQAQLEGDRATTAIWELVIFLVAGPVGSCEATRLQLQSGYSRFLVAGPVGRRQGYNCNLGTRDFLSAGPGDRATTAIWELEIFLVAGPVGSRQGCNCNLKTRFFGGRPSCEATRLQLQSGYSRFLVAGPVGRRQGYNCNLGTRDFLVAGPVGRRQGHNCNLGTRDFLVSRPSWKSTGLQLQSGYSRFLVAGPVVRRQGYNCNLGTRDFWWQAQLEGDRATTAIWEPEIFCQEAQVQLRFRNSRFFFGGRPSWKATGLQLRSGNSRFFGGRPSCEATRLQLQSGYSRFLVAGPVGRRQGYNCNLGTRDFLSGGPGAIAI